MFVCVSIVWYRWVWTRCVSVSVCVYVYDVGVVGMYLCVLYLPVVYGVGVWVCGV